MTNVVLTSVDCARPDAFGHRFFEKQKATGTYYDTCITQAAFTSPSHVSMLSGRNPFNHKVRWLIDYDNEDKLLPEILSEHGYSTAAFVGGFPLPSGNLPDFFDTFEHIDIVEDRKEGRQEYGPANVLVNRAINWLDDHRGERNFVFLHFFDLHFTFRSEFGTRERPEFDNQHVYANVEQYIGRQRRRYYDEADEVGRQLELLTELVELDTLVVTADHGTKMPNEHGYPWVYNRQGQRVGSQPRGAELYDNIIRVPLIFNGDGISSKTVHQQVRSIDIVPTLLSHLDLPVPDGVDGINLLNGDLPELAYSETYHGQLAKANKRTYQMDKEYEFGWSDLDSLVCIRTNEWKLICTANGDLEPTELYHIAQDPSEEQNLLKEETDVVEDLFSTLTDWIDDDNQRYREAAEVSDETRSNLEDLGYL